MQTKSYSDTIKWLFAQFPSYQTMGAPAYKPGLDNVRKLCAAFENPHFGLKFIHIAGSNGKGSTASMLASFLIENNLKVGLFTSPHLVDFRERIRVNGEMIGEQAVIDFCEKVKGLEFDFEPSFFEISFCMSLVHFLERDCDFCVIETGLGGRLDATNIIHPELAIITGISLEHTNFLGDTLQKIAAEKAGIIKEDVPVIIGKRQAETTSVFEEKANEVNTTVLYSDNYAIDFEQEFPLLGAYQKLNFKTACLASMILGQEHYNFDYSKWSEAISKLSANTGFQGRLQVVSLSPRVIYDVSHNAEGVQQTLEFLQKDMEIEKLHIVYGSSSDKNLEEIFRFFPIEAQYYMTEFSNERSAKKEQLSLQAEKQALNFSSYASAKEALAQAKRNCSKEDTILVFGSFFLLHDFLK